MGLKPGAGLRVVGGKGRARVGAVGGGRALGRARLGALQEGGCSRLGGSGRARLGELVGQVGK